MTMCLRVGIPFGSAIVMFQSARWFIRMSAFRMAAGVNRRLSSSLSHEGWCLLKSPHHRTKLLSLL